MNRKYSRRNANYLHRGNNNTQQRSRKLDMRRTDEFQYLLSMAVENLPDSLRGAIKGSIYSIASRKGSKEAKDYITQKREEGIIDVALEKRLLDLVFDYSKYS
ncbi:MAG: hypothetical protein M1267_02780 [Candidatus Thermoplasmatota archaeon]|jgi:hypothetical protein|nr:hypothetical protein [Candidatus Thermoplasmatota archaeon]MCL5800794.1 hypothetical protein [Candidatus Thermoplasmatota archaeon]